MLVSGRKRKLQARLAVCLLFLSLCAVTTSCGREMAGGPPCRTENVLDVWFFACSEDADSILLQTDTANIMIDTGVREDSAALVEKMRALGVEEIDLLILTHPDKDHIGGAAAVLDAFSVAEIIQTSCDKDSQTQETLDQKIQKEQMQVPGAVQEFAFDGLALTVYPPEKKEYEDANNYSIAVLAEYEGSSFFFAGDAKKKRIGELLDEDLPHVDVYKVAHHGRDNGKSCDLIEKLQPRFAVVTADRAEKKTSAALEEAGTAVYSTYCRDVHFTVSEGILDVE